MLSSLTPRQNGQVNVMREDRYGRAGDRYYDGEKLWICKGGFEWTDHIEVKIPLSLLVPGTRLRVTITEDKSPTPTPPTREKRRKLLRFLNKS